MKKRACEKVEGRHQGFLICAPGGSDLYDLDYPSCP